MEVLVCLDKIIDHGLSPVVQALPNEARHARSEATRFMTAQNAHNTD